MGSVTVCVGVISLTGKRGLFKSGMLRPGRKGKRFGVLLVLDTLLTRLRCGVDLELYSDFFALLVNQF